MNKRDVAAMIDHTILKPEATTADVARIVEEGAAVGVDLEHDVERGFTVTESGITVVPKGTVVRK